jgi:hypothetical protein
VVRIARRCLEQAPRLHAAQNRLVPHRRLRALEGPCWVAADQPLIECRLESGPEDDVRVTLAGAAQVGLAQSDVEAADVGRAELGKADVTEHRNELKPGQPFIPRPGLRLELASSPFEPLRQPLPHRRRGWPHRGRACRHRLGPGLGPAARLLLSVPVEVAGGAGNGGSDAPLTISPYPTTAMAT